MNIQEYVDKKKEFYKLLISFTDEDSADGEFHELINYLDTEIIRKDREELNEFLHLISKISKTQHRYPNFTKKIENLILHYKEEIKQSFSNFEIFTIFRKSKHVLLILFKNKILALDDLILKYIRTNKHRKESYHLFFYPEIKPFLNPTEIRLFECELLAINPKIFNDFESKRDIGENDSYICSLIRGDMIEDFIIYINQTNISIENSTIKMSIFETNNFLLDKEPTFLEYSAFFGSIQIFQYCLSNNGHFTDFLCVYAIHGRDAQIISIIEEERKNEFRIEKMFFESIKCHHNELANYIIENSMDDTKINSDIQSNFNDNLVAYAFRFYNYSFFPSSFENNKFIVFYLARYNYVKLFELFLKSKPSELNSEVMIDILKKKNFFNKILNLIYIKHHFILL